MSGNRRHRASEAAEPLKRQVRAWADRIGVPVKGIYVQRMRSKWASCSTLGRITLSADVLSLSPELRDYVVCHELLHLRVPNHGKLWKSLMRAYLGDYERLQAKLEAVGRQNTAD